MSWWVYLETDGDTLQVPSFMEGGTQPLDGNDVSKINITYNYGKHFDFKSLHDQKASDTIDKLKKIDVMCAGEKKYETISIR